MLRCIALAMPRSMNNKRLAHPSRPAFAKATAGHLRMRAGRHRDENRDPPNGFNLCKGSCVGARDDMYGACLF